MFWKRLNISPKTQNDFRILNVLPQDWGVQVFLVLKELF